MTAIVDLNETLELGTDGSSAEFVEFYRSDRAANSQLVTVSGNFVSFWRLDGQPGAATAVPTTAAALTRTTAGALKQANPTGSKQKWLVRAEITAQSNLTTFWLYDRLLHCGGLSGTDTNPQSVGGSIGRYTGAAAAGNFIFAEIYTQIGNTPTTITASYTNQDGASATTKAVAIGGSGRREAHTWIQLPFADGDTGARAVASVTLAGSTGTAGNFGVTIGHRLASFHIALGGSAVLAGGMTSIRNFLTEPLGPVEVLTDACLALAGVTHGTRAPIVSGQLAFLEK